jgi:hypothetical protein
MLTFTGLAETRASFVARADKKKARATDPLAHAEETLVQDDRGSMRPAQMVENKLSGLLPGAHVLVSQLRFKGLIGRRS